MSLKDFEKLSKLGEGSFSSVYKVRRRSDGQFYAMKEVKYESLTPKEKQNALNEIRVLASIDHPNIVAYKEAFINEATNSLCIIMDFAEEGDLISKIKKHRALGTTFPESEIWNVIKQSLLGLQALHSMQILHRDIKPANIFLSAEGTVKLGDLNVSKIAAGMARTQTGTPFYCSPEIWRDSPYDSKSDIWSLGISIYELACLDVPFKANSMKGVYQKVITGKYRPIPSTYSSDLSSVIKKMLVLHPGSRPSCLELLKSLELKRIVTLEEDLSTPPGGLLNTIRLPMNLRRVNPSAFPAPQYSKRSLSSARKADKENIPPHVRYYNRFVQQHLTPSPSIRVGARFAGKKRDDNIFNDRMQREAQKIRALGNLLNLRT